MSGRTMELSYVLRGLTCVETMNIPHHLDQRIAANPDLLADKKGRPLYGKALSQKLRDLGATRENTIDKDGKPIAAIRLFGGVGDGKAVWEEMFMTKDKRCDPRIDWPAHIVYSPGSNAAGNGIITRATSYPMNGGRKSLSREQIDGMNHPDKTPALKFDDLSVA